MSNAEQRERSEQVACSSARRYNAVMMRDMGRARDNNTALYLCYRSIFCFIGVLLFLKSTLCSTVLLCQLVHIIELLFDIYLLWLQNRYIEKRKPLSMSLSCLIFIDKGLTYRYMIYDFHRLGQGTDSIISQTNKR